VSIYKAIRDQNFTNWYLHCFNVHAVLHRIRILESNPAGYWDFFGYGLDFVSISTGSGFSDYPNETNCDHAKNYIE